MQVRHLRAQRYPAAKRTTVTCLPSSRSVSVISFRVVHYEEVVIKKTMKARGERITRITTPMIILSLIFHPLDRADPNARSSTDARSAKCTNATSQWPWSREKHQGKGEFLA